MTFVCGINQMYINLFLCDDSPFPMSSVEKSIFCTFHILGMHVKYLLPVNICVILDSMIHCSGLRT